MAVDIIKDLDGEIWKEIPDYNGRYFISNLGRVKSIQPHRINSHILPVKYDKNGYLLFRLNKNNIIKRQLLHRAIAIAFIPNPENKSQVNHKNGIKHDNRIENLEWCTPSENILHSFSDLGHKPTWSGINGECHPKSTQVNQLDMNGNFIKRFGSMRNAAKATNTNISQIAKVCKKEKWCKSANNFKWEYA